MAEISTAAAMNLLGMVQAQAPDGDWQNQLALVYNRVQREFGIERAVVFLCDTLSDGFRYGNWPWKVTGLKVSELRPKEVPSNG